MQKHANDPILDISEKDEAAKPFLRDDEKPTDMEDLHKAAPPVVGTSTTAIFLAVYFLMNICLTFYNKAVLGSVSVSILYTRTTY